MTPTPPRVITTELFQRVPPADLSDRESGSIPVAVDLCSGAVAGVYAGLIRRAAPGGCSNTMKSILVSTPGTIVRLLLLGLSDGRLRTDTPPVAGEPLAFGLPVLEYLLSTEQSDWVNLDELLLVYKANGIATPVSVKVPDPVLVSGEWTQTGSDRYMCLLSAKGAASRPDPNTAYAQRGSGSGGDIDVLLGIWFRGNGTFVAIAPAGHGDLALLEMGHHEVKVNVKGQKLECTGISVQPQFEPVSPETTTEDIISCTQHTAPVSAAGTAVVKSVSWVPNHRVKMVCSLPTPLKACTLVHVSDSDSDTGPSHTLALEMTDGTTKTIRCCEPVTTIVSVSKAEQTITVALAPVSVTPQVLSVPNCITLRPAHPDYLSAALSTQMPQKYQAATARLRRDTPYVAHIPMMMASGATQPLLCSTVPQVVDRVPLQEYTGPMPYIRRAQTEWAFSQLPPQSNERQLLELHDEIVIMITSLVEAGGKDVVTLVKCRETGLAEGVLVLSPELHHFASGAGLMRGVAYCPPIPEDRAERSKVVASVNALYNALQSPKVVCREQTFELRNVARSFATIMHDTYTCVPHLFRGFRTGTMVPRKKLNAAVPECLRGCLQPIALTWRPVRTWQNMQSSLAGVSGWVGRMAKGGTQDDLGKTVAEMMGDAYKEATEGLYVPENHKGRQVNRDLVALLRQPQNRQESLVMWSLYNEREMQATLVDDTTHFSARSTTAEGTRPRQTGQKKRKGQGQGKKGKGKKGQLKFHFGPKK
ncbi:hypothetical protein KIPB_002830 [Kipferlia bialata]|uniref:Uncharacterized protein n=1 Tax=Kipferlia bialata TaxID=797122 RepID=A0A9K3GFC1_9EUKA|nr:hypothetical protein KIPB_002830 [Kipferlia bialata]|eukprot:g2830.t1